jgi:hypothetical protein
MAMARSHALPRPRFRLFSVSLYLESPAQGNNDGGKMKSSAPAHGNSLAISPVAFGSFMPKCPGANLFESFGESPRM